MTVYYIKTGLTYHYSRECIHLKHIDSKCINTADETELARSPCHECQKQQEAVNGLREQLSR